MSEFEKYPKIEISQNRTEKVYILEENFPNPQKTSFLFLVDPMSTNMPTNAEGFISVIRASSPSSEYIPTSPSYSPLSPSYDPISPPESPLLDPKGKKRWQPRKSEKPRKHVNNGKQPLRMGNSKDMVGPSNMFFGESTSSKKEAKMHEVTDKYKVFVFGYSGHEILFHTVHPLGPVLVENISPKLAKTFTRACRITLKEPKTMREVKDCIESALPGNKFNHSKDGEMTGLGERDNHVIIHLFNEQKKKLGTREFSSYMKYNEHSRDLESGEFSRKEQVKRMMSVLVQGINAHEGLREPVATEVGTKLPGSVYAIADSMMLGLIMIGNTTTWVKRHVKYINDYFPEHPWCVVTAMFVEDIVEFKKMVLAQFPSRSGPKLEFVPGNNKYFLLELMNIYYDVCDDRRQ